jgi:hypothetical protein
VYQAKLYLANFHVTDCSCFSLRCVTRKCLERTAAGPVRQINRAACVKYTVAFHNPSQIPTVFTPQAPVNRSPVGMGEAGEGRGALPVRAGGGGDGGVRVRGRHRSRRIDQPTAAQIRASPARDPRLWPGRRSRGWGTAEEERRRKRLPAEPSRNRGRVGDGRRITDCPAGPTCLSPMKILQVKLVCWA